MGYLFVEKDILPIIKERKKIILDNIEYDFKIEKIKKDEDVYIVDVYFQIELENISNTYKLVLEEENLLTYFIRIVKGVE